jgi:hypothetical protein
LIADVRQLVPAQGRNIVAIEKVAASRGSIETSKNIHQGGLTRAARAHQRHEFALPNLDGNAAHGVHFNFAGPIRFSDILEANGHRVRGIGHGKINSR